MLLAVGIPMANLVKVQFTAKPALYPPHKGGQTWLHERAGVKRVPHDTAPGGFTTKVFPTRLLQTGDIIEVNEGLAKTLTSRYECFKLVSAESPKKTPVKGE